MTRWRAYAIVPLSDEIINNVYSDLRRLLNGKNTLDAVEILLNFVQTAFTYEYDSKVWGRDRAFFLEETLFYPYCDCEDRSALFGWLVRRYLNLSVIGLQYPGHLATAVCFGDDITIDDATAYNYGGKKYYVCDPTYINAKVGQEMPQFKNITPKVIKLKKM